MERIVMERFLKEIMGGLETLTNALLILLEQCQIEKEEKMEGGR